MFKNFLFRLWGWQGALSMKSKICLLRRFKRPLSLERISVKFSGHPGFLVCKVETLVGTVATLQVLKTLRICRVSNHYGILLLASRIYEKCPGEPLLSLFTTNTAPSLFAKNSSLGAHTKNFLSRPCFICFQSSMPWWFLLLSHSNLQWFQCSHPSSPTIVMLQTLCWCLNLSSQPFDATKSSIPSLSAIIMASSFSIALETGILYM